MAGAKRVQVPSDLVETAKAEFECVQHAFASTKNWELASLPSARAPREAPAVGWFKTENIRGTLQELPLVDPRQRLR